MKSNSDSFFHDFTDRFAAILRETIPQLSAEQAFEVARETADSLRREYAGERLYIPKQDLAARAARNREIYHKFNGENAADLCREYDISQSWLYDILKSVEREMKSKEKKLDETF